jgi:hypothetical protein
MREFWKIFLVNFHHIYPNINDGDVDIAARSFDKNIKFHGILIF